MIISDCIDDNNGSKLINEISKLENYINPNLDIGFPIDVIISKNNLLEKKFNHISYFYTQVNKRNGDKREYIRPRGLYATIIHKGNYEDTYISYNKLIEYIKNNGYEIVGNAYEECLLDFFTQENEENYLTRISIQVSKLNN